MKRKRTSSSWTPFDASQRFDQRSGTTAYDKRDSVLRAMGFSSYQTYLKSGLWRGIRRTVLAARPTCECCGARAIQCHHLDYSRRVLSGRDLDGILACCRACHHAIEFDRQHRKRSFQNARKVALEMVAAYHLRSLDIRDAAT